MPTDFARDAFAGTNGTNVEGRTDDMGNTWSAVAGGDGTVVLNGSGAAKTNNSVSAGKILLNSAVPPSANYSVKVDLASPSSGLSAAFPAIIARCSADATSRYHLSVFYSGEMRLYKITPGGGTQELVAALEWLPDLKIHNLTLEVSGSSPTTIKVYIEGVLIATVTDSSSPITAIGKSGMVHYNTSGSALSTCLGFANFSAFSDATGGDTLFAQSIF